MARVGVWNEAGREVQGSDWGDVSLRAKWRIVAGRPGRPTLGARFGVVLPQTEFEDEQFRPLGLGPNTLRAFAEALAEPAARPAAARRQRRPAAARRGVAAPRAARLLRLRHGARVGRASGRVARGGVGRAHGRRDAGRRSSAPRRGSGCGSAAGGCAATRRCGAASTPPTAAGA